MGSLTRRRVTGWALVASSAVLAARCQDVYLTAPSNSTIELNANPRFIASHGGVSEITAVVLEEIGTPVADGTVVFWTTDLGTIDRETRTRNGFARANLVSDSRSGIATVTAFSGGDSTGPAPGPSPTAPPTPAPSPSPSPAPTALGSGSQVAGVGTAARAAATATITVDIGNINVNGVLVRADPPRITISSSTHVFAVVIDRDGNPIERVPVYFDVPASTTEFFDFTGPVFTNNNGEAENVLRTRRQGPGTVEVRARAVGRGNDFFEGRLTISIL